MYPQFAQDLYYSHTLNVDALGNMIQLALAWMGIALCVQWSYSTTLHKKELWADKIFLVIGLLLYAFSFPVKFGPDTLPFVIGIGMYEMGFHVRKKIDEILKDDDGWFDRKVVTSLHYLRIISVLSIGFGGVLALTCAARIGHLL